MLVFLAGNGLEFILSSCSQFRRCTLSDVMKNYHADDGLAVAARFALFFTLIFSYPVLMNPCRDSINGLCLLMLRNCTRSRWFAVKEEEEIPETTNELNVCVCAHVCVHVVHVHMCMHVCVHVCEYVLTTQVKRCTIETKQHHYY